MKQIQIILLKRIVSSPLVYLFIFVFVGFTGVVAFELTKTAQGSVSSLLLLNHLTIDTMKIMFLIIPFFLSLNLITTDIYNKTTILLKYTKVGKWWRDVFVSSCLLGFLVVAIINGITILTSSLIIHESVDLNIFLYLIFRMIVQIACLVIISILYHIFVLYIKQEVIALFLTTFILFFQEVSKSIFRVDWVTLPSLMALEYKLRSGIFDVNLGDLLSLVLLFCMVGVLYLVGFIIVRDKDYYWSA